MKEKYLRNNDKRSIVLDGKTHLLPFSKDDYWAFVNDGRGAHFEAINKIYSQNPYHTAYRYLMEKNDWVDGTQSTAGEHLTLIAYLWLAASDEAHPPEEDGVTTDDRIETFIHQLALINRHYNQNKVRPAIPGEEEPADEAPDDLQPDNPLLDYIQVKNSLFQALLHHPLYTAEQRDPAKRFVRQHIGAGPANYPEQAPKLLKNAVELFLAPRDEAQGERVRFDSLGEAKAALNARYGDIAYYPILDELLAHKKLDANDQQRFYQSAILEQTLDRLIREKPLQQSIDQAAIEHLFQWTNPATAAQFVEFNQLVDDIRRNGVGSIWEGIRNHVREYYLANIHGDVDVDDVDLFIERYNQSPLSGEALKVLNNDIHEVVEKSLGYRHYCENPQADPTLGSDSACVANGRGTPFWEQAAPPSALIACLKKAAKKHKETSSSSDERKDEITQMIKEWEALPDCDIAERLCTLFEEKKGGWNKGWGESAFRSLAVWFLFNELQNTGLKQLQQPLFSPLPRRRDGSIGIRHQCNWNTDATVPKLCSALRQQFPAPDAERRAVLREVKQGMG